MKDVQFINNFINNFEVFLFNCDGVIWNGNTAIHKASEVINFLKSIKKQLYFITNDCSKSRFAFINKFKEFGININESEIICSSFLAAIYLKQKKFNKTAYIIGEKGLLEEFDKMNIKYIYIETDNNNEMNKKDILNIHNNIGAVVVGFDRNISYNKIEYARIALENPQCMLIVTNRDAKTYLTESQYLAGTGSMIGAVEGCTNRTATLVGKPSNFLLNLININPEKCLIVGDKLDIDILFANTNNIPSCLVLSGATILNDLELFPREKLPTFFARSIADFIHNIQK
ncbi:MAG: hypothetical protein CBD11_00925 [Phycisphaera sp. TMED151]|nr:MAG: hypothetical protein CBD11_00925 [Phycisphaera sp. TMED151]RPG10715.1 MAG: HAD-IIA family hydrolase [Phycisphaera sp. TMED24]|tara:strand:- start:3449 stop:4309 length:861 start_codon:yes stop_codon:yes gene_type:complete